MATEDARLIRLTLAGDTSAYAELMRRHQGRLYNTVYRLVGHAEDARDVVQEAFISAFSALAQFHGQAQFSTWLYRIAVNAAISQKRRTRSAMQLRLGRGADLAAVDPPDDSFDHRPGAAMERQEDVDRLQRALGQLGAEFRTVLVLREIDGRKYEEIAEMLDVPIGTVRSRIHRARLELRTILQASEAAAAWRMP